MMTPHVAIEAGLSMKLSFLCIQCAEESGGGNLREVFMPMSDDGFYNVSCDAGHTMPTVLEQMRFEVLAETAIQAIMDGYYRDAVSSFAASLERFYEFYVRVILRHRGLTDAQISLTWKSVAKQSERQLGVFVALFACETKEAPPLLHSKQVEFRNDVVHKGAIPSEDKALAFGQAVVDIVQGILGRLYPDYGQAASEEIREHLRRARERVGKVPVVFNNQDMVFQVTPPASGNTIDLPDLVEQRRRERTSPSAIWRKLPIGHKLTWRTKHWQNLDPNSSSPDDQGRV